MKRLTGKDAIVAGIALGRHAARAFDGDRPA